MLAADPSAAALHGGMSVGKRVDRLVAGGAANEICAHCVAPWTPHDVRQQIPELEVDTRFGQEHVGEPVHFAEDPKGCGNPITES